MQPEIKIWLKDIELSIKEVYEFFPAHGKYIDFKDDLKTPKQLREILKSLVKR